MSRGKPIQEGVRVKLPVGFFNLVLEIKLTEQEKKDLVAFMR